MTEEFDGYAVAEPKGKWSYELDDHFQVEWRDGPWPFARTCNNVWNSEKQAYETFLASVRIAPDTAYQAWRTQYVILSPSNDGTSATCRIEVYKRQQGMGGMIDGAHVAFDLAKNRFAVVGKCDPSIRKAVQAKARKILAFLAAVRAVRDKGGKLLTAQERRLQRQEAAVS